MIKIQSFLFDLCTYQEKMIEFQSYMIESQVKMIEILQAKTIKVKEK